MLKRLAFIFLASFLLSGCVLDGDGSSSATNANRSTLDNLVEGDIYVSVSFQHFPSTLQVSKGSKSNFYLQIDFDTNGNGALDEGDIWFEISHFEQSEIESKQLKTSELDAFAWLITEVSDKPAIHVNRLPQINYKVENNNVDFIINRNSHPALSSITKKTRIKVSTYYQDANEYTQSDYLPEYGYTPKGMDLTNMLDNTDDVYTTSSEPIIVDIQEVRVVFAE